MFCVAKNVLQEFYTFDADDGTSIRSHCWHLSSENEKLLKPIEIEWCNASIRYYCNVWWVKRNERKEKVVAAVAAADRRK